MINKPYSVTLLCSFNRSINPILPLYLRSVIVAPSPLHEPVMNTPRTGGPVVHRLCASAGVPRIVAGSAPDACEPRRIVLAAYPGRLQVSDLLTGIQRGKEGTLAVTPVGRTASGRTNYRIPGLHRIPLPPASTRGRIMAAAFAVGAAAAAIAAYSTHPSVIVAERYSSKALTGKANAGNDAAMSPDVFLVAKASDPSVEATKLTEGQRILSARQAATNEQANRPRFAVPATGRLTSGFASRWGTSHYGIDISSAVGTPIVAAADGVIIEAGPVHGFGLWVREQLPDDTILVYGHMSSFSVRVSQHVKAGSQIASMGSRDGATGHHLHFEVWNPAGQKIDPVRWLDARGIEL